MLALFSLASTRATTLVANLMIEPNTPVSFYRHASSEIKNYCHRGVCSSVVSALEYRMLYASVGAKGNPQVKLTKTPVRFEKYVPV